MGLRLEYTEPYHINKIQAWLKYMYCIYMYPIHFEVFVDNSATLFSVDETKVLPIMTLSRVQRRKIEDVSSEAGSVRYL